MGFFQLRQLAGNAWPTMCDGAMSHIWSTYQLLDRTQWLSPEEIEQGQLQQIRMLLIHCQNHVPYYRKLFQEAGIEISAIQSLADFQRLPLLPRRTYQENTSAFVAEALPRGTVATSTRQTSGSSGTPTQVFQTNMVDHWWYALNLRDIEWCEMNPMGTLAAIRSTGKKGSELAPMMAGITSPYWNRELSKLLCSGPAHLMDISQDHDKQLQWLRKIEPTYLISYPANLEVLALMIRQSERLHSLQAIQSISDSLSVEAQKTIEDAFGVPVKNLYSSMEAGYIASPCPQGHGLHVHSESVLLEVLDDVGQACQPGETGHVYVTLLHNFRAPLVRYALGDQVTLAPNRCPCGRGLPLLSRVLGKNSPMLHASSGQQKSSTRLAYLIRKIGGHWQHQVVQKAVDHIIIRIVCDPTWTPRHAAEIIQQTQEFFESPVKVDVETCDRLPMPASGKFQNMIVEMK